MSRRYRWRLRPLVECPFLAGLRRCHRQFARRKPAIDLGRTRPSLFKLNGDLERRLVADLSHAAFRAGDIPVAWDCMRPRGPSLSALNFKYAFHS